LKTALTTLKNYYKRTCRPTNGLIFIWNVFLLWFIKENLFYLFSCRNIFPKHSAKWKSGQKFAGHLCNAFGIGTKGRVPPSEVSFMLWNLRHFQLGHLDKFMKIERSRQRWTLYFYGCLKPALKTVSSYVTCSANTFVSTCTDLICPNCTFLPTINNSWIK
jgi:hypothetical protein